MTTADTAMAVTIDDAIRARPELLAKIEEASRFFEEEYQRRMPLDGQLEPTTLEWSLGVSKGREEIRARCFERDRYGGRGFTEPFPASYLFDDAIRESMMFRLLQTVAHLRGKAAHQRVEEMLRELEREEENGHPD